MLLLDLVRSATKSLVDPPEAVEHRFGGGDDVERGRDGTALFKVGDPEFASCKFPFNIGLFLWS